MPKISVIVPVYKVEKYLNRCVDSILNQTFTDFELILVDDGSPDNCGKMCDEYAAKDKRIVVIHKENGGLSDARNAGLDWIFANSDSEYIAFVDSDDWVHRQYLERLYGALIKNDADMSICDLEKISEDGSILFNVGDKYLESECFNRELGYIYMTYSWKYVVAWNKLYKRNIFSTIRYPIGCLYEDEYLIHHIFHKCNKIVVINERLYFYLQRAKSIMSTPKVLKNKNDILGIYKDRFMFFFDIGQKKLYQRWLSKYLNCFAENIKYIHATENNKAIYKSYDLAFRSDVKCYKRDLNENHYNVLLRSIDRCNFDLTQKIKYIWYILHLLSPKNIFKKIYRCIWKK